MHIVFKTTNGTKLIPVWQLVRREAVQIRALHSKSSFSFSAQKKCCQNKTTTTKKAHQRTDLALTI